MEKIDILRKAVLKARVNGYYLSPDVDTMLFRSNDVVCFNGIVTSKDFLKGNFCYYKIIFSHDFARALWGKDWQTYLQNMVILPEPLEYLESFVTTASPLLAATALV